MSSNIRKQEKGFQGSEKEQLERSDEFTRFCHCEGVELIVLLV